jgi:hypothetical protein
MLVRNRKTTEEPTSELSANPTAGVELLWAVFRDGLETYCREIQRGATHSADYREARWWIFAPDSSALTSFSNLCIIFDFDPRRLRFELLHFRNDRHSDLPTMLSRSKIRPAG